MFQGSIVALITPMDADGRLDLGRLPGLVDHLLVNGSSGIVAAGTTGESATLEGDEFEQLLEAVIDAVAGRVPVLAGTGSASTARAMGLTQTAGRLGADGALVVTPYYNRPTQAGLQAHYEAIAAASDLPIVLYNVPSRTSVDLLPETVERLSGIETIVAVKEAVAGTTRAREILDRCGDRIALLSGDDGTCGEVMLEGAAGVISVAANVAPGPMAALCALARAGDREGAMAASAALVPLLAQLSVETNPIPVKWAAFEQGHVGPGIRLPLLPLSERHRPALRACLEAHGLMPGTEQ